MSTLLHEVAVDFSGGGTFETDGTVGALVGYTVAGLAAFTVGDLGTAIVSPEDVSTRVLAEPGVSAERGRSAIASQSPPLANETTFALDNRSGDYSPAAGSPLYPNVDVGHAARWRILAGATTYPVAHGYVTELVPRAEWGGQSVAFRALSQLARLVGKTGYSSPLYGDGTQANGVRTSVALGYVLDAAGLTDTGLRNFDVGDTILNWFWIRPTDELFDLALRIWASEGPGARLYDDASGKTTFKRRGAEAAEARSNSVQATFRDTDDGADPWFASWDPASGEQNIVNRCSIAHVRRAVDAADAAFWSFGATVTLGASEARPFQVQPTGDDPIASVVALAAGTDYTVTAGSLASAVFDRTSGPFVTLTLTAGAGGATLTGLQVRGKLARVAATTQVSDTGVDTAASRARYGPKPLTVPTLGELDYLVAQSICNGYVTRGMLPRPTAVIEVPLATDVLIAGALPREVADRIAVINGRAAFARQMWVESVKVVAGGGRSARAYLGCEGAFDTGYGLWGSGLWNTAKWGV
ncbi:MAG TPA: hypothetical protein VG370_34980 [Chloroflexota bacterium]|nr:hypothetical protein [Chloroflexota bacterium]